MTSDIKAALYFMIVQTLKVANRRGRQGEGEGKSLEKFEDLLTERNSVLTTEDCIVHIFFKSISILYSFFRLETV